MFRNRPDQLLVFLRHIHPFLQRQELDYGIYVVNQVSAKVVDKKVLHTEI